MSDDKLHNAIVNGSKAAVLLNDETLKKAFATLRETYSEKLFSTSADQGLARETLYQAYRVIGEVEKHLQSVVDNGKIADAELKAIAENNERKKRFGII